MPKPKGRPQRPNSIRVHSILDADVVDTIRNMEPRDLAWSYKLNKILREWIAKEAGA